MRPDGFSLSRVAARLGAGGLRAPEATLTFADALARPGLDVAALAGKSVALATRAQLAGARALLALDGVARRLVVLPPDFDADKRRAAMAQAEAEAIVVDDESDAAGATVHLIGDCAAPSDPLPLLDTQWILPTSGTTGAPKLVAHRLEGLLGAIVPATGPAPVWATFYDIRRYGGLQIFLRAATGGATLVLSGSGEAVGDHVDRLLAAGVTHVTGTPSHWRRLLMSPHAARLAPVYVRLSGEIADQPILDALRAAYPHAKIVHAYASTEAGVGFEVTDEREGFPASVIREEGDPAFRVVDGSLRIRSKRAALTYVGRDDLRLRDDEGFVDTDDRVELRGERFHFQGRGAGVINIGGLKVHPEEVEQVINAHAAVQASLVKARRNPIVGDLLVADVVLKDGYAEAAATLRAEILADCRARLERHKAPASIAFVPALAVTAGGKLARRHA